MSENRVSLQESSGDCGCGPDWRKPKPNGTCAMCGGWLPGERPTLPWVTSLCDAADRVLERLALGEDVPPDEYEALRRLVEDRR